MLKGGGKKNMRDEEKSNKKDRKRRDKQCIRNNDGLDLEGLSLLI